MKKILYIALIIVLALGLFAGCGGNQEEGEAELQKIVVGASVTPHAEILGVVKTLLAEQGYLLEIIEFEDYVQPNLTLESGELDANYFQHQPYLDDFNKENETNIVSLASVHYEPFGIYAGKIDSLEKLTDGSQIAVPNDTTNEARALLLLEAQGLIKLDPNAGLQATIQDITENPKNLEIVELEAAAITRVLGDVDLAVINGNFAIKAGLNAATDAIAIETTDSIAATTFANILAIRDGDAGREDLKALVEALKSDEVKEFIETTYEGAVVPMF